MARIPLGQFWSQLIPPGKSEITLNAQIGVRLLIDIALCNVTLDPFRVVFSNTNNVLAHDI